MFEAKITVAIPALEALAAAILRIGAPVTPAAAPVNPTPAAAPTAPVPVPGAQPPTAATTPPPVAPYQTPAMTGTPMTAPSSAPAAPPIAPAPTYTAEQLQLAGGNLIRENPAKMPELLALLQQFGVPAITELTAEQMGSFATALRGLGGKL